MGRSNNIIHPTRGKISLHQQELLRAGDDERSKDPGLECWKSNDEL
jgi:hypothetical protein